MGNKFSNLIGCLSFAFCRGEIHFSIVKFLTVKLAMGGAPIRHEPMTRDTLL